MAWAAVRKAGQWAATVEGEVAPGGLGWERRSCTHPPCPQNHTPDSTSSPPWPGLCGSLWAGAKMSFGGEGRAARTVAHLAGQRCGNAELGQVGARLGLLEVVKGAHHDLRGGGLGVMAGRVAPSAP